MIPIQIKVETQKATQANIEAIQIIANTISSENLLKVAEKCKAKPDTINKSLKTGLSFI